MTAVSWLTPSEQSRLELLRRSAVPVGRILEPVGVEIQRTRDVVLLVLLDNPGVDVEEQKRAGRRGLRPPAREQLSQPFRVDKLVVGRQALDRQGPIGRPLAPTVLVGPDTRLAQRYQPHPDRRDLLRMAAVEHDLSRGGDPLRAEQPFDLGLLDAA